MVSMFMNNSCQDSVKHILRYLVGMQEYDMMFAPDKPSRLIGYTDSDYKGCIDSQKSTFGYCFKFGYGSISW